MRFREVSDDEWELIRPHLPPRAKVGRPRADDRRVLNGMLYVLTTGCRWMDVPKRYGHHSTAWRRLKRWGREGVWPKVVEALASKGYSMGKLRLDRVSVDSTTVKARKGGTRRVRWI